MSTKSGIYRFTAGHPIERVGRRDRPSTDALKALAAWRVKAPGRDFTLVQDGDESILVLVSFAEDDAQAAELHEIARTFGVVLQAEKRDE